MLRAYQSPAAGTHCAVQCAQIPNLASRNQSGTLYPSVSERQSPVKARGAETRTARAPPGRVL